VPTDDGNILTINTGSSSLKAAVYSLADDDRPEVTFLLGRIGGATSQLRIRDFAGADLANSAEPIADYLAALAHVLDWLESNGQLASIRALGHRLVHGGPKHLAPQAIDAALVADLKECVPLAPNHLPQAIDAIQGTQAALVGRPQFACFDTGFHRTLPPRARLLPLPRALLDAGVVRYGFHGLSYEYIVERLRVLDPAQAGGRAVIAHLGNGASMAAVDRGVGVDTSMGFTPTGGLVMGTRTGDLDPGALVYLLQSRGFTAQTIARLVNHEAGMLGVSGSSADMRDLLSRSATETRAAEAVELFCYQARKFIGAYAAALAGLDTVVFTAGIGENSAPVRQRICHGLDFLGLTLDAERNRQDADVISTDESRVIVRVIKTDEDLMIARHTRRLLAI
jgi:acetate kinase